MRWVRRILWIALGMALVIGAIVFMDRNSQPIAVDYLAGRLEGVAVWLALLGSFAAGACVAASIALLRGARLRLKTRGYRKAARDLETEVHQLRNLPLSEDGADPLDDASLPGGEGDPLPGPGPLAQAAGLERGP